jgi:hypothetical protein
MPGQDRGRPAPIHAAYGTAGERPERHMRAGGTDPPAGLTGHPVAALALSTRHEERCPGEGSRRDGLGAR